MKYINNQDDEYKKSNSLLFLNKKNSKKQSILDKIPEKYKGNDYIIHRLNFDKKKK